MNCSAARIPNLRRNKLALRDGLQSLALNDGEQSQGRAAWTLHPALPIRHQIARHVEISGEHRLRNMLALADRADFVPCDQDRKSVVEGKGVSVRVDAGGSRN